MATTPNTNTAGAHAQARLDATRAKLSRLLTANQRPFTQAELNYIDKLGAQIATLRQILGQEDES